MLRGTIAQRPELSAMPSMLALQTVLGDCCNEIHSRLGYEYAAIQLVRFEERVIETAYGTGAAAGWAGISKHYLDEDERVRDIQAEVVQTLDTVIVRGWDDRFDRWIYDRYRHEGLVRAFTPIVIYRNEDGLPADDWLERCAWEIVDHHQEKSKTQRTRIAMRYDPGSGKMEVLGTVEVGYRHLRDHIEADDAIKLSKLVCELAPGLRQVLLPYVLEAIVDDARAALGADSASLHFLYDRRRQHYVYAYGKGHFARTCAHTHPPRSNGLGHRSILARRVLCVPDPDAGDDELALQGHNPRVFASGIRAMAAAPLFVEEEAGVLYIGFDYVKWFTEDEIRSLELFASRAAQSIRLARAYAAATDRSRLLASLNTITQSLVTSPDDSGLLRQIAWTTLNIVAADVITIYEYFEAEGRFATPPVVAGRLLQPGYMRTDLKPADTPYLVVRGGRPIYEADVIARPLGDHPGPSFVEREGVRSACAIPLNVGRETVGVLFANYRRHREFDGNLVDVLRTLASAAAIAIRNGRMLETHRYIDRQLITTYDLPNLLALIVGRAASMTAAHVVEIRLLDPASGDLVVGARYPHGTKPHSERLRADANVVGHVLRDGKSIVVQGGANPAYASPLGQVRSELYVPLAREKGAPIGLLSIGSRRDDAFGPGHIAMVEALAAQAVIAIQNARNQEQLVAATSVAALRDLAAPLVHWAKRRLFDVHKLTTQIGRAPRLAAAKDLARQIDSVVRRLHTETEELETWNRSEPELVDVGHALFRARDGMSVPSQIEYRNELPPGLPRVVANLKQLTYVFANLLQNAVNAIDGRGTITVQGHALDVGGRPMVSVAVRDSGRGMTPNELEGIFRHRYPRRTGKGVTFGLFWTRASVRQLGGEVTVQSTRGKGSTFFVTLPAVTAGATTAAQSSIAP